MSVTFENYYIVIMAGGIGSRFWPKSRVQKPKQFLDVLNTQKTLIQNTFERFSDFIPPKNIYVVTSKEYVGLVGENLPELAKDNILGEPSRKNTAPCIAYVAFKIREINPLATILCSPADHLIEPVSAFKTNVVAGLDFAAQHEDSFVTIGVKPTHPNTGFGYIQYLESTNGGNICKVKTFTEKPSLEIAKQFVESGEFVWNAGIFIGSVGTILKAFETYLPDMYDVFNKHKTLFNTQLEGQGIEQIYPLCDNISFDYGVMEKHNNVFMLLATFKWNDLGTWNSVYEIGKKDEQDNVVLGTTCVIGEAKKNIVSFDKNKLVVIDGLEDFIVVDTKDALLIYPKSKEQKIKEITEALKAKKLDKFL